MPEKTVREMTAMERKHYSLEARMFHAVEIASAVLGLVALLIGLGLYLYALVCLCSGNRHSNGMYRDR